MISIIYYIVMCLSVVLVLILIVTAIRTLFETRRRSHDLFMVNRLQRQIERLESQLNNQGFTEVNKQKLAMKIEKLKAEKQQYEKN